MAVRNLDQRRHPSKVRSASRAVALGATGIGGSMRATERLVSIRRWDEIQEIPSRVEANVRLPNRHLLRKGARHNCGPRMDAVVRLQLQRRATA